MVSNILKAVEDLRQGRMIIVTDDINRENEGDIVVAAEKITPDLIAFMAKKASGLICVAINSRLAKHLQLGLMVEDNQESMKTAFTVSVDARHGVTTGISAADRAKTILDMVDPNAVPTDLVRPGHIFPLIAKEGGLLARRGHTEASVTLAQLAGLKAAAVICEIMDDHGHMLRNEALHAFAKTHELEIIRIEDLIHYLKKRTHDAHVHEI